MASRRDNSQPTSSEGKSNDHLSPICIQTNATWFIDLLIGTLLFQISVISSLASSEMSRKETEVSPLVQSSLAGVIGEESGARNLIVALLGQTYRLCPEPERLPLLWNLADIFSPIAPGNAHRGSHVMTSVETSLSRPPSPGHSQPGRTTAHAVALHRYTSALHERGQRESKRLERIEEQTITLDPPLFKVIVQYGNVTCSGMARTKKEAAHLGAKEICRQLNETI
ncbi:hypothetical protein N7517_002701 [Penicillium concentricum]|uniref:DRBM domain-containing protein n=1 Tax=Penicillium concentricum TaxID=293559 RepID=A0A9W9VLI3_9EURO|nr:uncharacterized protein N7517_002701 [Penicillium concentricum]KAJ5384790.1 hypothetical protein N7517_002701 [Penicillium concentricum]